MYDGGIKTLAFINEGSFVFFQHILLAFSLPISVICDRSLLLMIYLHLVLRIMLAKSILSKGVLNSFLILLLSKKIPIIKSYIPVTKEIVDNFEII